MIRREEAIVSLRRHYCYLSIMVDLWLRQSSNVNSVSQGLRINEPSGAWAPPRLRQMASNSGFHQPRGPN